MAREGGAPPPPPAPIHPSGELSKEVLQQGRLMQAWRLPCTRVASERTLTVVGQASEVDGMTTALYVSCKAHPKSNQSQEVSPFVSAVTVAAEREMVQLADSMYPSGRSRVLEKGAL